MGHDGQRARRRLRGAVASRPTYRHGRQGSHRSEIAPQPVAARRERRNRAWVRGWLYVVAAMVLAIAVVFCLFALSIAYFGAAQQGSVGYRGIEVTIIPTLISGVPVALALFATIWRPVDGPSGSITGSRRIPARA